MTDRPKYVLCLAYDFPPQGGGAVARIHAFVKYLPQYGYTPIVLTVDPAWYDGFHFPTDSSLFDQLSPETQVFRTPMLMPRGRTVESVRARVMGYKGSRPPFAEPIRWALKTVYRALMIPDQTVFWLPYAVLSGWQIVRRIRPAVILVTTPPHGVGVIGALLSRLTHLPMVLDVRDDWGGNPLYQRNHRAVAWMDQMLERFVIGAARRVIAVTPGSVSGLQRRFADRESSRFVYIPNGFDPDIWSVTKDKDPGLQPAGRKQVRMIYGGSLKDKRTPRPLFKALSNVSKSIPDLAARLEVTFVGTMRPEFEALIGQYGLTTIVSFQGFRQHSEFIKLMQTANVGIVIILPEEGSATAIPGKTYEYAAAGLHILALAEPGSAVAEFVRAHELGSVADVNDPQAIGDAVIALMEQAKRSGLRRPVSVDWLDQFDRRTHTRRLAAILDEAVAAR